MRVLDANFLIDYLDGQPETAAYYESVGGEDEHWVIPAPAYAEALVGVGNLPDGDVKDAIDALAWGEVYGVDEQLSVLAGRITEEIGPQGPYLDGIDAIVAAVGRELGAPVVSADSDLTHPATQAVISVEEYRD